MASMNTDALISVIIPIYNCEKYLEECIDSVLNQTYRNIEVVLVNDGSTDNSLEICRRYKKQDNRIVLINQKNGGEAAARNRGLDASNGEIVMFVDADDLLVRNICEQVNREMKDYDLMIMGYQPFHRSSQIKDRMSDNTEIKAVPCDYSRDEWIRSQLGPVRTVRDDLNLNTVWAKAYSRAFIQNYNIDFPLNVMIGTDMLFNLKVYLKTPKVCSFRTNAYFYRYNYESVVHRYIPNYHIRMGYFQNALNRILGAENLQDAYLYEAEYQKTYSFLQAFSSELFHRSNPKCSQEKKSLFYQLVNDEEYQTIIPNHFEDFGMIKRCVLVLAIKKQYTLVRWIYYFKESLYALRGLR